MNGTAPAHPRQRERGACKLVWHKQASTHYSQKVVVSSFRGFMGGTPSTQNLFRYGSNGSLRAYVRTRLLRRRSQKEKGAAARMKKNPNGPATNCKLPTGVACLLCIFY